MPQTIATPTPTIAATGQRQVGLGGQAAGDERAGGGEAGLAEAQDAALPRRHREAEEDHGERDAGGEHAGPVVVEGEHRHRR